MSKKDRERAERGLLFRDGHLVPKEQVEQTVKKPMRWRARPAIPSFACSECGEPAIAVVGKTFYCQTHLDELVKKAKSEAENGKENPQAVHNADTSGGDERGETPGARRNTRRRTKAGESDAR